MTPGYARPSGNVPHRGEEEVVLPGDLDTGEVIMLPGAGHEFLVKAVPPWPGPIHPHRDPDRCRHARTEQLITLTAATHLRKHR
jgi:hypothetical protein